MTRIYFLIYIFIYLFPLFTYSAEKCKWNVGWEHFYPYSFHDRNGELVGVDIDLLNIISAKLGCNINYIERPWQRLLMELRVGEIDIVAGASRTSEREEYSFYSQVYRYEEKALFVRKEDAGKFSIKTLEDLVANEMDLVVTRGHFNGEEFENARKDSEFNRRIFEVLDNRSHSQMLINYRADGYFDAKISGMQLLKQKKLNDQIVLHGFTLYKEPVYVMFSKNSFTQHSINEFNNEIINIKKSGEYQRIITKNIR